MATIDDVLGAIDAGQTAALERLFAFLSIPSISAVPAHFPDCERAADWLAAELGALGFEAAKRPTPGRPMVVGHIKASRREAPHVLFYGHYDVQPVDPLSLWRNPPFEPKLEAGPQGEQILARGASDDKGQLMTFLEACRAFRQFGGPPCHVTVLFEGEEETGSPSLAAFLADNAKELKADVALVCDTGMWDRSTPAITMSLRGIVGEEVVLTGANRDLHSGIYGGLAVNPIHVLARILGELHDDYVGCRPAGLLRRRGRGSARDPRSMECAQFRRRGVPARHRPDNAGRGAQPHAARAGLVAPDLRRQRNGGGYVGEGFKTVLPAKASAKVSFRLVGKQSPDRVAQSFRAFVTSRLPPDVKAEFISHAGSPAISLPVKSGPAPRPPRARGRMGSGGAGRQRRVDPDRWLVQARAQHGQSPGRLRPRGRPDPLAQRKIRAHVFHKGARSWARILAALAA